MKTIEQFEGMIESLPKLLGRLESGPAMSRDDLGDVPKRGIYAFYEKGEPIYVGRSSNMRARLMSHGRRSSDHHSATFAFLLAVKDAKRQGIDTSASRDELQQNPDFEPIYLSSKIRVSQMKIRAVEVEDAIGQTVFEVYAALALKTPHNTFENH